MDTLETDKLPVYGCDRSDWTEAEKPIGHAADKREAARLIRDHVMDPAYRASDVYYSEIMNAYFTDE